MSQQPGASRNSTVALTARREFLKLVTFGTASSVIAGKLWQHEVLAFCDPLPGQKDAVFKLHVSDFPALQQNFGSVRLGINPVRPDAEPFPDDDFWPFLINRDGVGNFHVLDCECRHAGCVVPTFDSAEPGIRCPCHGSLYGIDGAVLGGPAPQALHRYPFEFDGVDTLSIHIPCWGFSAKLVGLPGGPNARVHLDFDAFPQVTYEVTLRERARGTWSLASFAITPDGPADQTSLIGFGGPTTIYPDRTTSIGFYAIGRVLSEV